MVAPSMIVTTLTTAVPIIVRRELAPLSTTKLFTPQSVTTTLPPQTTPFRPLVHCDLSVYCPFMSDELYYTKSRLGMHPLSGQKCQAFYTTAAWGTTSGIDHVYACLPSGYEELVGDDAMELGGWVERNDSDPRNMIMYPGTECAEGWTSACQATMTNAVETVTQQWCCPVGGWTCQMATDDTEPRSSGGFDRLCKSIMTEPTEIFMSFDPPTAIAGLVSSQWTWHRPVVEEEARYGATVFHTAFPIEPATASSSAMDGSIVTITTNHVQATGSSDNSALKPVDLTAADLAGIAAGGTAFLFILLAAAIFAFCCRRKRQVDKFSSADKKPLGIEVPCMAGVKDDNAGPSTGSTVHGAVLKAELDSTSVMGQGQTKQAGASEMSGVNYSTYTIISQNDSNSPQPDQHGRPDRPTQYSTPATWPPPSHQLYEMQG